MAAVTVSAARDTAEDQATRRDVQVGLVFAAICITAVATLAVSLLFPAVGADGWFSYASVQPSGAFFWAFLTLAAVNLVVAVVAGIIATLLLVSARGWRWATAGAALAVVGVGFYAAGVGGWAMLYYFAANSSQLDATTATAFIESVNADGIRLFGAAAGGAGMIALAVVLLSIGLWRSGNVPKWLPVVAVIGSLITFVLPTDGPLGVLVEAPQAITSVITGWLAWQFVRTSHRTSSGPPDPAAAQT